MKEFLSKRNQAKKESFIYFLIAGVSLIVSLIFLIVQLVCYWEYYFFIPFFLGLILFLIFSVLALAKKELFLAKNKSILINELLKEQYVNALYRPINGLKKDDLKSANVFNFKHTFFAFNTITGDYNNQHFIMSDLKVYRVKPIINTKYSNYVYLELSLPYEISSSLLIYKNNISNVASLKHLFPMTNEKQIDEFIISYYDEKELISLIKEDTLKKIDDILKAIDANKIIIIFERKHINIYIENKNFNLDKIPFYHQDSQEYLTQRSNYLALAKNLFDNLSR